MGRDHERPARRRGDPVLSAARRLALAAALVLHGALAQDAGDLAKAAQNPVAAMISLPLQKQPPVLPFTVGGWNIVSRTIAPVVYAPGLVPDLPGDVNDPQGDDGSFGLGDVNQSFYFSPAAPGPVIWASARRSPSPPPPTTASAATDGAPARPPWRWPRPAAGWSARSCASSGPSPATAAGRT